MRTVVILCLAAGLSACGSRGPARTPGPSARVLEIREGLASYYGAAFHGKTMASGRAFDMNVLSAAHPTYPFGTLLRVTNLTNGRQISVRVLDRGPAPRVQADGVIIDVSQRAAQRLGFIQRGRVRVRLEVLEWGRP